MGNGLRGDEEVFHGLSQASIENPFQHDIASVRNLQCCSSSDSPLGSPQSPHSISIESFVVAELVSFTYTLLICYGLEGQLIQVFIEKALLHITQDLRVKVLGNPCQLFTACCLIIFYNFMVLEF